MRNYPQLLAKYLKEKGRIIITVPSKQMDKILDVLLFFKLIHDMDLQHHQVFNRQLIKSIFTLNGFKLLIYKRYKLGLNILYVFEKQ